MSTVTIIDVGHGNSTVIENDGFVAIVDGGRKRGLISHLEDQNLFNIHAVLISHGDDDHISGIIQLLLDTRFNIHFVYLNPDHLRSTAVWHELKVALGNRDTKSTIVVGHLQRGTSIRYFDNNKLRLDVVSPSGMAVVSGPGGHHRSSTKITSNSMSAVVKISYQEKSCILLAADMNQGTLSELIDRKIDIQCPIVIYPHHGGRSGATNDSAFAKRFCDAVQPQKVFFSLGRNSKNPRPSIIRGIKKSVPTAYIACTQLSEQCLSVLPISSPTHLTSYFADGRLTNSCCAGTVVFELDPSAILHTPSETSHKKFLDTEVPNGLCRLGMNDLIKLSIGR